MKYFLLITFLVTFSNTYSQNIALDMSFGNNGYSAFDNFNIQTVNDLTDTVMLPNGQFITGYARITSSDDVFSLKKIDSNGYFDTSFFGGFQLPGSIKLKKLVYHNDKLIFVGSYSTYPFNDRNLLIVRFNLNGDVDTTFGTNGYTFISYGSNHDDPIDTANDDYGNIYIYAKHSSDHYLVKVDSNGIVDNSFGTDGKLYLHYYNQYDSNSDQILSKVFLQNDGKFLFTGAKKNSTTNIKDSYLVRKLQDGTYDPNFGNNGEVIMPSTEYSTIKDFEYNYDDDSILILHEYNNSNFTSERIFLSKIQISNGALIPSFANNGMTTQYYFSNVPRLNLRHINSLSDSKILVVGSLSNFWVNPSINTQLFIMRFNSDGSIDYSSSSGGYHIFNTTPPESSMRADHINRLFYLNDDSFIIAYSGDSATHGANSYLTKFNGATLGLDDLNNNENNYLTIFPNPSKDNLIIKHKLNSTTNFNYEIVDLNGRIIQSGNSKFNKKIKIELPTGTYIIYLESELGEKNSKKIIVK